MDLSSLAGRWSGRWSTWVEPEVLYSESPIEADVEPIFGGRAVLIRYTATLDGDVEGLALIGSTQDGPVVAWLDTWHTSGLVMASHGPADRDPMVVSTTYTGEGQEWRWTSEYRIDDEERFVIRHYNEGPGVDRYLGVEIAMSRAD